MSPDPTAQIAALGIEPTYSTRQAAAMLGRSFSWLDHGIGEDKFVLPDGTKIEPRRTAGGYRRFSLAMLEDIALSCYRHGWFSMEKLTSAFREVAMCHPPRHRRVQDPELSAFLRQLRDRVKLWTAYSGEFSHGRVQ